MSTSGPENQLLVPTSNENESDIQNEEPTAITTRSRNIDK